MTSSRGRIATELLTPRGSGGGAGRLWLPLLAAPLFTLSPIAGCALGGRIRQAALPAATPALEAPRVTFAEPAPAAGSPPAGTTVSTPPGPSAPAP